MDEGSSIRQDLKDSVDKVKDKEPSHELEKNLYSFFIRIKGMRNRILG